MKRAHAIKLRVIVGPGQEELVKERLLSMLGLPLSEVQEEEDISFDVDEAEDFSGNDLHLVRTSYTKTRNTNRVLDVLREKLPRGDREMVVSQEDRLDDDLNFHIRLDLDAFLDGAYILTEDGDCVHVRVKVAAYPAKRDEAMTVVRDVFGVD